MVADAAIDFHDRVAGVQSVNLARAGGDFVIFKADGLAAYQLAVVVDDAQAGVDAIVRGQDLLESTARQIHLRRLLGFSQSVGYWHLPLVVGPDGRRLAKRHGDTRLSHYRQAGATAERILGLLGYWCGLLPAREECDLARLEGLFDLERLPRVPIVFSAEDEGFLIGRHQDCR
jgi:glutamyl-tRNA synthetase